MAGTHHRMGRRTKRVTSILVGQKTFVVDDEEVPLLEIRSLEFATDAAS